MNSIPYPARERLAAARAFGESRGWTLSADPYRGHGLVGRILTLEEIHKVEKWWDRFDPAANQYVFQSVREGKRRKENKAIVANHVGLDDEVRRKCIEAAEYHGWEIEFPVIESWHVPGATVVIYIMP